MFWPKAYWDCKTFLFERTEKGNQQISSLAELAMLRFNEISTAPINYSRILHCIISISD
jgi:hypothetical protein